MVPPVLVARGELWVPPPQPVAVNRTAAIVTVIDVRNLDIASPRYGTGRRTPAAMCLVTYRLTILQSSARLVGVKRLFLSDVKRSARWNRCGRRPPKVR